MEILNCFTKQENLSVALGFFDGIHTGHKAVILSAVDFARKNNLKSAVVTFKDAPHVFFSKEEPKYIISRKDKIKMLEDLGVDYLYLIDFDENLSKMTASEYLKQLVEYLNPKFITTGYNHYFGFNKSGNVDYLRLMKDEYGYEFNEIQPISVKNGVVSSSKIRECLLKGDLQTANSMLGYRFYIENEVIKGQQLGRTIGIRTANLLFPKEVIELPNGVYATEVQIDGKKYMGIANYGCKPTVTNVTDKILEVHILNFDEDIYGKVIKVNFLAKIRDEKKFQSLIELKEQIKKDIECLES